MTNPYIQTINNQGIMPQNWTDNFSQEELDALFSPTIYNSVAQEEGNIVIKKDKLYLYVIGSFVVGYFACKYIK